MKTTTRLLLAAATLLSTCTTAVVAQSLDKTTPKIQVTGTATITLMPDELRMTILIRHENANAEKTMEAYRSSRESVLAALKDFNVGDSNIIERGLSFVKQIRRDYRSGKVIREYFQANTTINIVIRQFDSYPELVMALTDMPGVELSYVRYYSAKEIETRETARQQAMEEAKRKAEKMAAVCGATIGSPLLITENIPTQSARESTTIRDPVSGGIARGEVMSELVVSDEAIKITVFVYAEFELK